MRLKNLGFIYGRHMEARRDRIRIKNMCEEGYKKNKI